MDNDINILIKNAIIEYQNDESEKCKTLQSEIKLLLEKTVTINDIVMGKINNMLFLQPVNSDLLNQIKEMIIEISKAIEPEEEQLNEIREKLRTMFPTYNEEEFYKRTRSQYIGNPLYYKAMIFSYQTRINEIENKVVKLN
jgi:hypothetical protein